jgi:hypothetical protein
MAKTAKKTKKTAEEAVRDLLNQVVLIAGDSEDEFLSKASAAAQDLLKDEEEDEDYYDSDGYYNSNC